MKNSQQGIPQDMSSIIVLVIFSLLKLTRIIVILDWRLVTRSSMKRILGFRGADNAVFVDLDANYMDIFTFWEFIELQLYIIL